MIVIMIMLIMIMIVIIVLGLSGELPSMNGATCKAEASHTTLG